MPSGPTLATIAPRLHRAVVQRREERARLAKWKARIETEIVDVERLIGHRDLQVIRALRTRDIKYIQRREQKLERARDARARLDRAMAQCLALGAEEGFIL